jgi:hypothetical protein
MALEKSLLGQVKIKGSAQELYPRRSRGRPKLILHLPALGIGQLFAVSKSIYIFAPRCYNPKTQGRNTAAACTKSVCFHSLYVDLKCIELEVQRS